MLTDKEAREQIIQITNELFAMGLLTCTGGNISALAEEPGTFWITPSQLYKGGLTQADLVRIRPDGKVLQGERVPSVEYQMHWRAYEVRPETAGAVHTHAPIATAARAHHGRTTRPLRGAERRCPARSPTRRERATRRGAAASGPQAWLEDDDGRPLRDHDQ